jgi:hypothetical protein
MLMLDIGAGLGGASQSMRARGWDVVTVDVEPRFNPDIVADIRDFVWHGARPDLVWISMPCTEFSRESMPWCRTGNEPDMSLVLAGKRFIETCQPRYWVMENVRGALHYFRPYFGEPAARVGPFFLWGNFPPLGTIKRDYKKKESYGSKQRAERAKIPAGLSLALAQAIEWQGSLFEAQPSQQRHNKSLQPTLHSFAVTGG